MPTISYEGQRYDCSADETVLAGLARHGVILPSGCQSGSCLTCMTQALKGRPSKISQRVIKDTLRAQNYFLPCICKPKEDLEIGSAPEPDVYTATVIEKSWLNDGVLRLRINRPIGFEYYPGQFIHICRSSDGLIRSYSLASLCREAFLELHIKRMPDGQVSGWLCDDVEEGDELTFTGPMGDCFYVAGDLNQPLLLAGTGTGLAPLYGIVRDAMAMGHRGKIRLLHASLAVTGLYYMQELKQLQADVLSFSYNPCVLHGDVPEGGRQGAIDKLLSEALDQDSGWRVFLCGDGAIVKDMRKTCFLAGLTMQDIYADEFVDASKKS